MRYTYDPITGVVTKHYGDGRRHVYGGENRPIVMVQGKSMPITHLIWVLMVGRLPYEDCVIDHKNNCPVDNRWKNLQEISKSINIKKRKYERQCICERCLARRAHIRYYKGSV